MAVSPSSAEAVWRWSAVYDDVRKDIWVSIDSYTPGWWIEGFGSSHPVLHTDPERMGSDTVQLWTLSTDPYFTPGAQTRLVGTGAQPFYTGDPDMLPNEIYYLKVKIALVGNVVSDWSPTKVIVTPRPNYVKVGKFWKPAVPYVKAGGTWHQAVQRAKVSGHWKS